MILEAVVGVITVVGLLFAGKAYFSKSKPVDPNIDPNSKVVDSGKKRNPDKTPIDKTDI